MRYGFVISAREATLGSSRSCLRQDARGTHPDPETLEKLAADHASQARIPQSLGRLFSMPIQVKSIPLHTILSMLKAGLLLKADHRKPGS